MPYEVRRDFIGYGANAPHPKWPNGARLAVNFVMNYEEGSEPSLQDGEDHTEIGLSDAAGMRQSIQGRDLAAEGLFEYGSEGQRRRRDRESPRRATCPRSCRSHDS